MRAQQVRSLAGRGRGELTRSARRCGATQPAAPGMLIRGRSRGARADAGGMAVFLSFCLLCRKDFGGGGLWSSARVRS